LRLPLLFFLLATLLFSAPVDKRVLEIQARLFPRIVLFDRNYSEKLQQGSLVFAIIGGSEAVELKHQIERRWGETIKGVPLVVTAVKRDELLPEATAYYIFEASAAKNVFQSAGIADRIIFAYDEEGVREGGIITLEIGRRVIPVINKKRLQESGITFDPAFLATTRWVR